MAVSNKNMQQEWMQKTLSYADYINECVSKRRSAESQDELETHLRAQSREHLVSTLIDEIKAANQNGNFDQLRTDWPLAYEPLLPMIRQKGQVIPVVCLLPDNRILARIGEPAEPGYVVEIQDEQITTYHDICFFGYCSQHRYFAVATASGVSLTEGWQGEELSFFEYPKGNEGVSDEFQSKPINQRPIPTRLIPFPDGNKVLFVSRVGIYVLQSEGATRLLPLTDDLHAHYRWMKEQYPDEALEIALSMEHGAISPAGDLIAVGCQDSSHLVFDADFSQIADLGHLSEYPHHALFSSKGDVVAFNSCHFYQGATIGVQTNDLEGLKTAPYEPHPKVKLLQDGARVYAGIHRYNEFIVGDSDGYLKAFGETGESHWQHFIGSTFCDMDISKDGSTLVCSTHAGFISIVKLDCGGSQPYEIGNGGHTEQRRWLFWKEEARPLAW